MNSLYIFSFGGLAREVYGTAIRCGFKVEAFIDKDKTGIWNNIKIINENLNNLNPINAVVAVGNPILREKIVLNIKNRWPNCIFPNIIDPTVIFLVPETITLGEGIVIQANCILTTNITLKNFVQLNIGTQIGHDSILDDYVTTAMDVQLAGWTLIGKKTRIGSNSTTKEHINICDNVIIGAGACIVKSIIEKGTYVGIPTKKIK